MFVIEFEIVEKFSSVIKKTKTISYENVGAVFSLALMEVAPHSRNGQQVFTQIAAANKDAKI